MHCFGRGVITLIKSWPVSPSTPSPSLCVAIGIRAMHAAILVALAASGRPSDGDSRKQPSGGSDKNWEVELLAEQACAAGNMMRKGKCYSVAVWDIFRRNFLRRPTKRKQFYENMMKADDPSYAETKESDWVVPANSSAARGTATSGKDGLVDFGDVGGASPRKKAKEAFRIRTGWGGRGKQQARRTAEGSRVAIQPQHRQLSALPVARKGQADKVKVKARQAKAKARQAKALTSRVETPMQQLLHKLHPFKRDPMADAKHPELRQLGDALAFDATKGLLFIHVPKAGGTSIELALKHVGALSTNYTIGLECKRPMLTMAAENLNAAHVVESMAFAAIHDCHGYTRPVRSFAVLREPASRLYSSYRWLRQRAEVIPRFSNFSTWVKHPFPHLFKIRQTDFLGPCTRLFALESGEVWDFLKTEYPAIQPIQVQSRAGIEQANLAEREAIHNRRAMKAKATGGKAVDHQKVPRPRKPLPTGVLPPRIDPDTSSWIRDRYRDDLTLWTGLMARAKAPNGWRLPRPPGCVSGGA